MKITSVQVMDPRASHDLKDPELWVVCDDVVQESGPPTRHGTNWRVVPCGSFVALEKLLPNSVWTDEVNVGEFNTGTPHREQLIDVRVWHDQKDWLVQMGVRRAMRELRRHEQDAWHIIVDQEAALNGTLKWRIERKVPVCYGVSSNPDPQYCPNSVVTTSLHSGAHLPFCPEHAEKHNKHVAWLRAKSRQPAHN